jgi:hypothetical protein
VTESRKWTVGVVAATAVAWGGFFIHNVADLPGQTILSPESLLPSLTWMMALVLWLVPTTRAAGAWALLVWAAINLVGGALSAFPLPFLPFTPEQTLRHYAFHALYAVSQIPLIMVVAVWLQHRRNLERAGLELRHSTP